MAFWWFERITQHDYRVGYSSSVAYLDKLALHNLNRIFVKKGLQRVYRNIWRTGAAVELSETIPARKDSLANLIRDSERVALERDYAIRKYDGLFTVIDRALLCCRRTDARDQYCGTLYASRFYLYRPLIFANLATHDICAMDKWELFPSESILRSIDRDTSSHKPDFQNFFTGRGGIEG